MNDTIDDSICLFCQKKNQCMAHAKEPCWCNNTHVPEELKALAPERTRAKVCICRNCIQLFKENPIEFKKRMNICA